MAEGEMERVWKRVPVFRWRLRGFSSLRDQRFPVYRKPEFRFCGRRWCLILYPNGTKWNHSEGDVELHLYVRDSGPPTTVRYSAGIMTAGGGTEACATGTKTFKRLHDCVSIRVIRKSELMRRRDELLPGGNITVTLTLEAVDASSETVLKDASVQATVETNVAHESVRASVETCDAGVPAQTPVEKSARGALKGKTSVKRDLCRDKCIQASLNIPSDLESLSGDISQLLKREIFPDVKLRCGDRNISAHRSILAARSEVFFAMLGDKMVESETGTVDITDVDPDVLDLLLKYMYSGKIPDLSHDIASSLHEVCDKYSIHSLKRTCSDWMVRNLTAENCLGYLLVADTHSDEDFKEAVVDFAEKHLESLKRDDWFRFNRDHALLANSVYQRRCASALAKQA